MKRIIPALVIAVLLGMLVGTQVHSVRAQAATPVFQITGAWQAHTSCVPATTQTTLCIASDGLWVSVNGGAFAQVQTGSVTAGVTSVTVNGGTPQTGAVSLTIPSKATSITTTTLQ